MEDGATLLNAELLGAGDACLSDESWWTGLAVNGGVGNASGCSNECFEDARCSSSGSCLLS